MFGFGNPGSVLDERAVREVCAAAIASWGVRNKRVLAIVPDQTRSAPLDLMFRVLHDLLSLEAARLDVLIALGTHPPMSDEAIDRRLGIAEGERATRYAGTRFFNHRWDDPAELACIGSFSEEQVHALSGGRLCERVDVTINRRVLDYDLLLIIGPTFPHEVVGFSGGNKYLFPGIAGQEFLNLFHWLAALITNPEIIGNKYTPVRAMIDQAAAMVPVERKCLSLVVEGQGLAGLFAGDPEEAWSSAADLSNQIHVVYKERAFNRVLSCAPAMYDELWVGGKCAYKLEPVVADGGELIIFAPHIQTISRVHGSVIRRIGYHVRDYFTKQMARFTEFPRGVLAHSTHVKGIGTFEDGVERPRISVTLATGISEAECRAVNLGYRDHRSLDPTAWAGRESEGVLLVPKAGETLFRLSSPS